MKNDIKWIYYKIIEQFNTNSNKKNIPCMTYTAYPADLNSESYIALVLKLKENN